MLTLDYQIEIGKYNVKHLLECEVRKSANQLADTATIKLSGMAYSAALDVEKKIRRGDAVTIRLGYAEQASLQEEFTGYVSSIKTDNTIEIGCTDGMFQFHKGVNNEQMKKVGVADVAKKVAGQVGGFEVEVHEGIPDLQYDKFTIQDATAYEVLKKLQDENHIQVFVKGRTLHLALQFTYKEGEARYDFSKDVEKSNLKYIREEDKKAQIEMIGIRKDNSRVKVTAGEPGGDRFTSYRYNVTDKKALETAAQEELAKYKITGYEGSITTWLLPYCTYGHTAQIIDPEYPSREGKYYVEAVTTKISRSGGTRKVTLSKQLS